MDLARDIPRRLDGAPDSRYTGIQAPRATKRDLRRYRICCKMENVGLVALRIYRTPADGGGGPKANRRYPRANPSRLDFAYVVSANSCGRQGNRQRGPTGIFARNRHLWPREGSWGVFELGGITKRGARDRIMSIRYLAKLMATSTIIWKQWSPLPT